MSRRASFPGGKYLNWITIVLVLVLVSYGSYWQRGGYADDFAFLGYLTGQPLPSAIMSWGGEFNSRLTQSVLIPPALALIQGAAPGEVHWWAIHLSAILLLCMLVYLLYRILELFPISRQTICLATLVFALHPIKSQVVFWPATIFGYLYPLFFFMLGTYIYWKSAAFKINKPSYYLFAFCLYFIAACGIEQLIPLIVLVLAVRLLAWRVKAKAALIHVAFSILLMVMVAGVVLIGRTMDRVEKFGGIELSMIWDRLDSVLTSALRELVVYPARFLLDRTFYSELSTAIQSPAFLVACVALVILVVIIMTSQDKTSQNGMRHELTVILVGAMTILLSLTPFLVTGYYMPSRVLFIPSIGFSLVCGAFFGMLWSLVNVRWLRMGIAVLVSCVSLVYVMTNRTIQVQFAELWGEEESVVQYLLKEYPDAEPGTSFALLHFPRLLGAVPTFVNDFSFPGIIRWLYRNETITGTTDISLSSFLGLDEYLDISRNRLWVAKPDEKGVVYSGVRKNAVSLDRLLTVSETSFMAGDDVGLYSNVLNHDQEPTAIAVVSPLSMSVDYTNGTALELRDVLWLRNDDLFCARITVHAPSESDRLRLLVHARYKSGHVIPYDRDLLQHSSFRISGHDYYADVLIDDAGDLTRLEFQLYDSGRPLVATLDIPSRRIRETVLTRVLSPGITVDIVEPFLE